MVAFLLFLGMPLVTCSQREGRALIDSLVTVLPGLHDDTSRVRVLASISYEMRNISPRDALVPGLRSLHLADELDYAYGKGLAHYSLLYVYHFLSRLPESVDHAIKAREIFENTGDKDYLCATYLMLAYFYKDLDKSFSSDYMQKATALLPLCSIPVWKTRNCGTLGNNYRNLGMLDSATRYMKIHLDLSEQYNLKSEIMVSKNRFGYLWMAQGKYDSAYRMISEGLEYFRSVGSTRMIAENLTTLGRIRLRQSEKAPQPQKRKYLQEAAAMAGEGLEAARSIGYLIQALTANRLLTDIWHALKNEDKAYDYLRDALRDYDSVYSARIVNKATVMGWKIEKELKEQQVELLELKNRQQKGVMAASIIGVAILCTIALLIVTSKKRLNKAYHEVQQHEEEIARVVGELEITNMRLEASNQELEAFSYSVSHDLRAPVRRIEGLGSILREDYESSLNSEGKDLLNRITSSAVMMQQLIEDMLKLSRITSTTVNRTSCNVSDMARRICAELPHNYPGIMVKCVIEDGLIVSADARLLQIVLQNLLDNAWKYSSKTPDPEVTVRSEHKEGKTILFVSDKGAGFDMNKAGKLFTPFQRMHSDEEFSGTGIGLATVKRIIMKHGGTIQMHSETGRGTTCSFTLEG